MTNGEVTAETGADAFTKLGDAVRSALGDRGFSTPTEPQRRAIPPIAAGRDALVIAPTGTGKTETAMLPVFDAIVRRGAQFGISALYVTPLRALNRDMRSRLSWWADQLDLEVGVRHGDTTDYERQQQAEDPPDVLITTPETLQAMLTGSKLRRALADVEHLIVDEVHELASSKRGAQLTIGLERLAELAGDYQRIGLSATVGDPEEIGRFLTAGEVPAIIEIDAGSNLDLQVVDPEITDEDERLAGKLLTEPEIASHVRTIRDIVTAHDSTLVFVNTRQTAEALGSRFKELDANIGVHHGSLSREARIDIEDQFKAGEIDTLLCTSSMELGIDVGRVDHVVQYGSPREVTRLLQRVGRAGHRADEVSAGTIVSQGPDDTLEAVVIARRAIADDVEPTEIHDGSLDTLANQLVGLVMGKDEIDAREAYEIVTRAYPYRDLDIETFKQVVREIADNRLIWLDEEADRLEKTGGTWQYYYANLSMIPDEETYEVYDMAGGTQVGTLDERFVVNFAEPGATFIQRGEMWRVVEIEDEDARINVSPIEDPAGEVPSWTGEEIPVPYGVAQEVGELRSVVADQLQDGADPKAVVRDISARYPADDRTLRTAIDPIIRQVANDQPIPTDRHIVVEEEGRSIVVNAAFGHQANETLGRLLSALVGQAAGSSVGMEIDPYRIDLDVPTGVHAQDVVEVLEDTDPEHVEAIIELSLKRSDTLKFTLAQVAETFGAVKRYRDGDGIAPRRLLAALEDTPVYDEAVRAVFHDDLAVTTTSDRLEAIQTGDIGVTTVYDRTPIGIAGRTGGKELLTPENADASVIETVKERLQEDRVILLCLHCTDWDRRTKVKRVPDQPECPECGSTRIAALSPWADDMIQAVRAQEKDDEQEQLTERAYRNANLVQSHGRQAVTALAARGVGPQTAARVIAKLRENEADFYRDILAQERQYARTKAFWD
ncbi:MAG: DEAD/DEAH box helicase [Halobacteriales archaeon]